MIKSITVTTNDASNSISYGINGSTILVFALDEEGPECHGAEQALAAVARVLGIHIEELAT